MVMNQIQEKINETVSRYLKRIGEPISESAKATAFSILLNELFGLQPTFIENYLSGIEKYIKTKQTDQLLRGEVDNLFGNLVIEFEKDLVKTQKEAEEQLKKYIACLWSEEKPERRVSYLCIATDGLNFKVFSPKVEDFSKQEIRPEEVQLKLIEKINIKSLKPEDIYFWLDRYFRRQEPLFPETENIVKDFGINSHAFQIISAELSSLWKNIKDLSEFEVVYENWEKYLRIVYGSSTIEEELFIKHTYLANLTKLIVASRFSKIQLNDEVIASVLSGDFFKRQGIENFLEEDFFSWIIRKEAKETGIKIARKLLSLIRNYDFSELSEDVLKSLYQELVDPETRHDLGEYYTPDWLAHRIVLRLIEQNEKGFFLDPACGSGTFLYFVIKEKRKKLSDTVETLEHILSSVVGIDIHPLAVITAKANYLLALGDLLKIRQGRINIPIYFANSIKPPEEEVRMITYLPIKIPSYKVSLDREEIYLPEKLVKNPILCDEAIDAIRNFAVQNVGRNIYKEQFFNFIKAQHSALKNLDSDVMEALFNIARTLKKLIEERRDTIWTFVLKNIYKPLFLRNKFDFVIGNPPWLAYRYADSEYQKFLKDQITEKYNLLSGRGELITHLELGTFFFVRTADLYLKEDSGIIAFVLPKSIFNADQHDGLRQGKFKKVNLSFIEIWDCEKVQPLFNVPSCVLFAKKGLNVKFSYPVVGQILEGKLERRNASLEEAEENLSVENVNFYLHKVGERSFWHITEPQIVESQEKSKVSYYKKLFRQGATLVPRTCWFVEIERSPLGFDPNCPPIKTSEEAIEEAKKPYKDLVLKGRVEKNFLYATLLSKDILPFGHLDYRIVVLPIKPIENEYRLIDTDEARRKGFIYLANWLEKVEKEWNRRRESKAEKKKAIEWLNYRHKLTSQNPQAAYRVLYNTSGVQVCACVQKNELIRVEINGQDVLLNGFVVDYTTFYFETFNELEAFYLVSVLNSALVSELIKPMKALRHICKKVLEFPIPQFNPSNPVHYQLAKLGELCNQKIADWLKSDKQSQTQNTEALRRRIRKMLQEELKEINNLVFQILRL
jgi:methylase of polypeptide subunit release factors